MAEPRLSVEIDADASGATRGFDRAGDAAQKFGNKVKAANENVRHYSRRLSAGASRQRKFQLAVQNASFQVGDFATQVGAGTSASIALGQQLPQLIGGFGVLGAALGAAVAIGVPLVRVLGDIQKSGKDLTPLLGEAAPLFEAMGSALASVKAIAIDFAELLINNLDRVIFSAAAVATFFAGKFVVSFVAAKAATFSLTGALVALRKALMLTGFGALIVGAGYLIERFVKLAQAAGGFQKAFDLVAKAIGLSFQVVGAEISKVWHDLLTRLTFAFSDLAKAVGMDDTAEALAQHGRNIAQMWGDAAIRVREYRSEYNQTANEIAKLVSGDGKQLFKLGDLFGGANGEGEGAGASEEQRNKEQLAAKLKNITDSFLSEKELLYAQLAEKQAILDEAHNQELLNEQEHLKHSEQLRKQHGDKIAAIEQAKRNTMLTQAANTFGALQSMAMSFGKKGAKVAQVFGLAKALISTFTGAAKALELPFPANIAAFAQVLATGMGAVASIKGVNTNGGGNSASGGGRGAAPVAAAPKPLEVMIQGLGANDLITGGQLSSLFDKLVDEAGDRGIRPVFA